MPEVAVTALTAARSPFGIPSPFGGRRRLSSAARLLATWADSNGGLAFDFTDITASQAYGSGKIIDSVTPANNWETSSSLTPFDKLTFTRASTAYYYNSSGILTQAASGTARIDYNPSTLAVRGLLVEEARTNLHLYSGDLGVTTYYNTVVGVTQSSNQTTSPDGTTTAASLIEDSANSRHFIIKTNGITVSTSTVYAYSCYFKPNGRNFGHLIIQDSASNIRYGVVFTLTGSGAIGSSDSTGAPSGTSATIQQCANGWYRCTVTMNSGIYTSLFIGAGVSNAASPTYSSGSPSYTGDGVSGVYVWGGQLEAGSFATSYIPTTSASVTRAAENLTLATSAYNKSWPVTMYSSFISGPGSKNGGLVQEYSTGQIAVFISGGSKAAAGSNGGTSGSANSVSSVVAGSVGKVAVAFDTNDLANVFNAATPVTDATVSAPNTTRNNLYLGYESGGGYYLNGHLRQVMVLTRRMVNADLVTLTT